MHILTSGFTVGTCASQITMSSIIKGNFLECTYTTFLFTYFHFHYIPIFIHILSSSHQMLYYHDFVLVILFTFLKGHLNFISELHDAELFTSFFSGDAELLFLTGLQNNNLRCCVSKLMMILLLVRCWLLYML